MADENNEPASSTEPLRQELEFAEHHRPDVDLLDGTGEESRALSASIAEGIKEELSTLLPDESRKIDKAVTRIVTDRVQLSRFSGPIAPPSLLREYEQIVPGSAKEIIDMSIREQSARHKHFERSSRAEHRMISLEEKSLSYSLQGLYLGAFIVIMIAGIGVYALTINQPIVAGICLGASVLGGLARLFITGRDQNKEED